MQLVTKSGKQLHPIGIGTWDVSSRRNPAVTSKYGTVEAVHENEEAEVDALRYSLSKGQNHLHCAELYGAGHTNEVLGRAMAGFPREDLYVTNMLWKTSVDKNQVRAAVEQILRNLGTDYLDLLYIHFPWGDAHWREAIPQIDELITEGVVRHFGVSNFTVEHMQETQRIARHPIAANQMNFNVLYKDEVNGEFREFCEQHGIQIVAFQPIKRQEVLTNAAVQAIAAAHDAAPAQVALAWLIQMGALPIPKATNKAHIDENLQAVSLVLTDKEMTTLEEL